MQHHSFQLKVVLMSVFLVLLLVQGIVVDVEIVRELPATVDFFILELVIVEAHPLQVDNKIVGHLCQHRALHHVALLTTGVALVVRYNLTIYVLAEGLLDRPVPFDLKRKRVEVFQALINALAVGTDGLLAGLAPEHVLQNAPKGRGLEGVLDLVKEDVQELLGVLLDGHVHGLSLEVLEGEAEPGWIVVLSF